MDIKLYFFIFLQDWWYNDEFWALQSGLPMSSRLPNESSRKMYRVDMNYLTYIPTIIIIITYHTVKLTITMARIVVYYYVLLVDFFKDTEKNEFYIPFTCVVIYFARFCIHTKKKSLKISTTSHHMFSWNLKLRFFSLCYFLRGCCVGFFLHFFYYFDLACTGKKERNE